MTEDYIPKNLYECLTYMMIFVSPEALDEFKKVEERWCILGHPNSDWGLATRNNWGLWDNGSELSKWFANLGVYHADDKSAIILKALYFKLNDREYDINTDILYYQEYWSKMGHDVKKECGY